MMKFSIGEASRQTGLSIDTIRYYERIELLVDIDRDGRGHRCYSQDDLNWLNLLICLRETGMPIAKLICFAELARQGDHTVSERLTLLSQHREHVMSKIAKMHKKLTVIDRKIARYSTDTKEKD